MAVPCPLGGTRSLLAGCVLDFGKLDESVASTRDYFCIVGVRQELRGEDVSCVPWAKSEALLLLPSILPVSRTLRTEYLSSEAQR